MLSQEEINEIYDRVIEENIEVINKEKKQAKIEKVIKYIIIIISIFVLHKITQLPIVYETYMSIMTKIVSLGFLGRIVSIIFPFIYPVLIIICFFVVTVILNFKINRKFDSYIYNFYNRMMTKINNEHNEKMKYSSKEGIDEEIYIKEGEFEKFDKYASSDLMKGILSNNCKFEIAQIIGKYLDPPMLGSQIGILDTVLAQGFAGNNIKNICNVLMVKIEMPTDFNISLYLREDIKNDLESESFRKSKIEFDSGELERFFDVYASDEEKAKLLLNEDIIKTMLDFYDNSKMRYEVTIKNKYIYIKFETIKIFSHSLSKGVEPLTKEGLYQYYKILNFTLDLTNRLLDIAINIEKEI